jgi:hypothetical protein
MRPTFVAFGILVIYAVSNIYLEHIVNPYDPLLKTAFFIGYFILCISPLLYFWLKRKIREGFIAPILVLCLAILYISALTTMPVPVGRDSPDIAFHAAKVLYSSTGHFFNDPITSFPSIYPSVYHILLGWIMRLSGSHDSSYLLSRFHILMLTALFMSVYLFATCLFNSRVGLLASLSFGGIFMLPVLGYMFIPMPFHLGLVMIINSATLIYLALQGKRRYLYPAGLLAGLAVTVWPAFLPVALALVVVFYYAPDKKLRRWVDCLKFSLPFLVFPIIVWLPQYLLLSKYDLLGSKSVGLFKTIPGLTWFLNLLVKFIFFGGLEYQPQWVTALFGINYIIFITLAFLGLRSFRKKDLWKKRFWGMSLILMLAVIILVHYSFGPTYSCRVQLVFSIPLITVSAYYLVGQLNKKHRILSISFIVWLVVLTCGWNVYNVNKLVQETKDGYEMWEKYCPGALQFIQSNTADADYIFATKETYRFVVLGKLLRFNLVAHRDGTYYSLNPGLSEKMLNHYNAILSSNDFGLIKKILNHYAIRYILIHKGEEASYPGLRQLLENCRPAYQDDVFTVLELK